jgi:hypothetical protein
MGKDRLLRVGQVPTDWVRPREGRAIGGIISLGRAGDARSRGDRPGCLDVTSRPERAGSRA